MSMSPVVQSAEKGSYPEVMCATEENLDQARILWPHRIYGLGWSSW